jgi:hypothetical protein
VQQVLDESDAESPTAKLLKAVDTGRKPLAGVRGAHPHPDGFCARVENGCVVNSEFVPLPSRLLIHLHQFQDSEHIRFEFCSGLKET